ITGVDCGVCLDNVWYRKSHVLVWQEPANLAYDAVCHRVAQAKRVSNCDHLLPNLQLRRVAKPECGEMLACKVVGYLEHRDVAKRVCPYYLGRIGIAIYKSHVNCLGAFNDVIVCYYQTLRSIVDKARP